MDNTECTVCKDNTIYPDEYMETDCNIVRDLECKNILNQTIIDEYLKIFNKMWELSIDIDGLLK